MGQTLGTGSRVGRLPSPPSLALWHSRLGHTFVSQVQVLASKGLLGSVSNESFDCISCQLGKQLALPFNNNKPIASASFDLIHFDVWGLISAECYTFKPLNLHMLSS
jgi:hypothetical protein